MSTHNICFHEEIRKNIYLIKHMIKFKKIKVTHFEKFASVWTVLAISVRFLAAFSGGNSCVR